MKHILILTLALFLSGCSTKMNDKHPSTPASSSDAQAKLYTLPPVEVPIQDGLARAYFAGGCFWCVEAVFESIRGVTTYKLSNTGRTGHAEAVEIIYDPEKISFAELVDAFFASHDPTQKNGQGPDSGSQYRAIAFFQNAEQKLQKFWVGEDYHQNYERLNPGNPYVQKVSVPRLRRFQAARPELLKDDTHE